MNKINQEILKKNKELKNISDNFNKNQHILIKSLLISNCISEKIPLKEFIKNLEKKIIINALLITNGNQKLSASLLGIKPTTLNEKIKNFDIKFSKLNTPNIDLIKLILMDSSFFNS